MILRTLFALLLGFWVTLVGAQELQPVPQLKTRVTDLTGTLSAEQREALEARLTAFEREKGAQIAILIVPTTKPEAIEQYSIRVAEQWKLGRKGVDDGVLLLIAKQDKKLRIEVGYGLEGALNDATAKRIIAETITPRFKEGRFYEGIEAGLDRLFAVVGGEILPAPAASSQDVDSAGAGFDLQEILIVGVLIVVGATWILRRAFGRFLGAAIAGGVATSIASFFVGSMIIAGVIGFLVFIFSLVAGSGRSSGLPWHGGGFSSGGSSSSSWSSSSSDSFSGGGGDFGGGGASGDW